MNKATITKLLNMLCDDDICGIAREFCMNADDDLEFEDRCNAMKYISKFTKSSSLKDRHSEERFTECIGKLIGYSKACEQFRLLEKSLKLETGTNPIIGFEMEIHEAILYPTYEEICSCFMEINNPTSHEYMDFL